MVTGAFERYRLRAGAVVGGRRPRLPGGFEATQKGQSGVVSGFMNKVQAALAGENPDTVLARTHRRMVEPGRDA